MAGPETVGVDDRGTVRVVVPGLGDVAEGARPEGGEPPRVVGVAAEGPEGRHAVRLGAHLPRQARPAWRPEKRQPPRKVPSSER